MCVMTNESRTCIRKGGRQDERVCSKLWKKRRNVRHREYRLGRM